MKLVRLEMKKLRPWEMKASARGYTASSCGAGIGPQLFWPRPPGDQHNSKRQARHLSHTLLVPPQLRSPLLCLGDKPPPRGVLGTNTRPRSPLQGGRGWGWGSLRKVLFLSSHSHPVLSQPASPYPSLSPLRNRPPFPGGAERAPGLESNK